MGGSASGRVMKRRQVRAGRDPFRGVDRRMQGVRAYMDRKQQVVADNPDMSAVFESVVERFVFVESRVLAVEADALAGRAVDLPVYLQMVQTLTRLADRVGYARRAKQLPRALEYAAQVAANVQEDRRP